MASELVTRRLECGPCVSIPDDGRALDAAGSAAEGMEEGFAAGGHQISPDTVVWRAFIAVLDLGQAHYIHWTGQRKAALELPRLLPWWSWEDKNWMGGGLGEGNVVRMIHSCDCLTRLRIF